MDSSRVSIYDFLHTNNKQMTSVLRGDILIRSLLKIYIVDLSDTTV